MAAELGLELRWASQKPKSPENQTLRQGPRIHTLEPSQANPLRVRKLLWSAHSLPGNFTWESCLNPHNTGLSGALHFQRWKLRLENVKPEKYTLLVQGSLDQTIAHPVSPSFTFSP